jgi:drug/metabolite transporter (DMT)-like permease
MVAVLIWGAIPFVIDAALLSLSPSAVVSARMLLAGAVMSVIAGPRRLGWAIRQNLRFFLALSLFGFALPSLMYATALQTVPIPVLTFVANSYPALAIGLAALFLHERPTRLQLLGMGSALVGLFLMSGIGPGQSLTPGIVLVLLTSLGWASAGVVSKKLTARLDATTIVAGRHLLSGLFILPLLLVQGPLLRTAGPATWLILAVLVAMSLLSFEFYVLGLAHTSVAAASLLEALTPVITLLISVVFLGEGLSGVQLLAAGLVLVGTVLASLEVGGGW